MQPGQLAFRRPACRGGCASCMLRGCSACTAAWGCAGWSGRALSHLITQTGTRSPDFSCGRIFLRRISCSRRRITRFCHTRRWRQSLSVVSSWYEVFRTMARQDLPPACHTSPSRLADSSLRKFLGSIATPITTSWAAGGSEHAWAAYVYPTMQFRMPSGKFCGPSHQPPAGAVGR